MGDDRAALAGTGYHAVRRLGIGGTAEVWEARHELLGTPVAVKVLRRKHAASSPLHDRMRVEAQVQARVVHPHVMSVIDYGITAAGRPFLVMPYFAGITLDEVVASEGRLQPWRVQRLLLQLLSAVQALHEHGWLHRDIKPANVLLCAATPRAEPPAEAVKLLDLGASKMAPTAQSPLDVAPPEHPTRPGHMIGTPRYCAPEQAFGYPLGPACDVYTTGLLAYELLTGRKPFHKHHGLESLIKAHALADLQPVSAVDPALAAWDPIVAKALMKKPGDRYASTQTFADAIAQLDVACAATDAKTIPINNTANDVAHRGLTAEPPSLMAQQIDAFMAQLKTVKVPAPVSPPAQSRGTVRLPLAAPTGAWQTPHVHHGQSGAAQMDNAGIRAPALAAAPNGATAPAPALHGRTSNDRRSTRAALEVFAAGLLVAVLSLAAACFL